MHTYYIHIAYIEILQNCKSSLSKLVHIHTYIHTWIHILRSWCKCLLRKWKCYLNMLSLEIGTHTYIHTYIHTYKNTYIQHISSCIHTYLTKMISTTPVGLQTMHNAASTEKLSDSKTTVCTQFSCHGKVMYPCLPLFITIAIIIR